MRLLELVRHGADTHPRPADDGPAVVAAEPVTDAVDVEVTDAPVWGTGPFTAATVKAPTAGELTSPARAS